MVELFLVKLRELDGIEGFVVGDGLELDGKYGEVEMTEESGLDGEGVEGYESTCWELDPKMLIPIGLLLAAARVDAGDCGTASSSFAIASCVASA